MQSVTPWSSQIERAKIEQRLKKRRNDPDFGGLLQQIRMRVSAGSALDVVREFLKVDNDNLWYDCLYSLAYAYAKPENIALEYALKNTAKYQMAAQAYKMAQEDKNYEGMMRALLLMDKIDNSDFEVKKYLGLLKPIKQVDHSEGITDEDVLKAQQEYEDRVEQQVLNQLKDSRAIIQPIDIALLSEPPTRSEIDNMGQSTLDAQFTSGRVADNQNSQSLTNGSIDVLNTLDHVSMQNKEGT